MCTTYMNEVNVYYAFVNNNNNITCEWSVLDDKFYVKFFIANVIWNSMSLLM